MYIYIFDVIDLNLNPYKPTNSPQAPRPGPCLSCASQPDPQYRGCVQQQPSP